MCQTILFTRILTASIFLAGRPPGQNQRAVSSVSESASIPSVGTGRNEYPESQTYTASATVTTTPSDANRPLSPLPVCSTVEGTII